ncbi:hypothetical protein AAHB33_08810 [Paenarthrobacter sp. S56]|uniref:hypothetical protein n=1 Tax=Paenarthrobacter sp. S56 TaxID=3138179 RepID=UPI00321B777F
MAEDEIRTNAQELIEAGVNITHIWVELMARGGNGSVADLKGFLDGVAPADELYSMILAVTLKELRHL